MSNTQNEDVVSQAQEDTLVNQDDEESEKSSSLSDDDDEEQGDGADLPVVPPSSESQTTEKKPPSDKKGKPKPSQNQYITYNLGSLSKHWDATLITKTDAKNIAEKLGQFPIHENTGGSLTLSDLERKPSVKNQARHEFLVLEEGGIVALNTIGNMVTDAMVEHFHIAIDIHKGATLTHAILEHMIKATFAPEYAAIFVNRMNEATVNYDNHTKASEVAEVLESESIITAPPATKPESDEEDVDVEADGDEKDADGKSKMIDRSSKAKRALINVSVGKVRNAIRERGISRISEGVDIKYAAFLEEIMRQFLLYAFTTLRETQFGCAHLLSVGRSFAPLIQLNIELQNLCVPMLNPSSFETAPNNPNGAVIATHRCSSPLSITHQKDGVHIQTYKSDAERIEDLRIVTSPGTPSWVKSALSFQHLFVTEKARKETLHKHVETTAKLLATEESKETSVKKSKKTKDSKKRKREDEAALPETPSVQLPPVDEVPLKKKAKGIKAT